MTFPRASWQWKRKRKPYRTEARFYIGSQYHGCIGWCLSPIYPGIPDTARSWLIIGINI